MGVLVRAIGSGVGLLAESVAGRKQRSKSPSARNTQKGIEAQPTESRDIPNEPPPAYREQLFEVPTERAEELIASDEAIAVQDEKQDEKNTVSIAKEEDDDSNSSSDNEDEDEQDRALDDAAREIAHPSAQAPPDQPTYLLPQSSYGIDAQPTLASLLAQVTASCPPPQPASPTPLRCPVIIPQRRPGARDRGFISAYAPDLIQKGISETTFLLFLKNFHLASQASPLLNIVFVGAGIAGFLPFPPAMIASTVVQVAAGTAMELQRRSRTNDFLPQVNEVLFMPRGLFAMIMTFDPVGRRGVGAEMVKPSSLIERRRLWKEKQAAHNCSVARYARCLRRSDMARFPKQVF